MKSVFKKAFGAAIGLALGACGTGAVPEAQAASAKPRPAMWKLADRDTTIYLFGTIHLLPQGMTWRTKKMEKALASSDELVTEVVLGSDTTALAKTLLKLGVSPGLPPIEERVPPEKREQLRAMIKESGIPAKVLDRLETWAAALQLTSVTFKQLGLDKQQGVEVQLTSAAVAGKGKPLRGLETAEEQFGFFDQLPETVQREFLLSVLEQPDEAKRRFAEMMAAWTRGDVDGIARSFNDEMFTPALRQRLLTERNRRWADWLATRLDRPGTIFVAVGAGHLAGEQSVQHFLAAKGLKAKRVQ